MNFFEYQERKFCKSRSLTVFESPQPPKEFVPRSEDLVEMESMMVTETALSDEEVLLWKITHGGGI